MVTFEKWRSLHAKYRLTRNFFWVKLVVFRFASAIAADAALKRAQFSGCLSIPIYMYIGILYTCTQFWSIYGRRSEPTRWCVQSSVPSRRNASFSCFLSFSAPQKWVSPFVVFSLNFRNYEPIWCFVNNSIFCVCAIARRVSCNSRWRQNLRCR